MNWQADTVQAVIFTAPGVHQDDALQLWSKLFPGDSPDAFQKASTATPALNSSASGERDGNSVGLNVQVGRIDLVINPAGNLIRASTPDAPPRIADVPKLATQAGTYMKRVIAGTQPVRLAIVLDLGITITAGSEGAAFAEAIPELPLPAYITDPNFQVNVRKPFDVVPSLPMNRLCNWSSGSVGFMQAFPGVQAIGGITMSPFLGLKIDCNTAPEHLIPSDAADTIVNELVQEAMALLDRGYARLLDA